MSDPVMNGYTGGEGVDDRDNPMMGTDRCRDCGDDCRSEAECSYIKALATYTNAVMGGGSDELVARLLTELKEARKA